MNSKLTYIVFLFLIFPFLSVSSDRTSVKPANGEPNECLTDFDPNATMITFYGDSLGDLIDSPLYGYFGWDWYLTTREPRVRWDIQNLAVSGNRTPQVYELIRQCSSNSQKRKNFRTADRVALEIGGNYYLSNLATLYYMPWKFADVDQRVTYNTRVIVRALRNSLRNKQILLMGNFPVISKSPILGDMEDYFIWYRYIPNGQIIDKNRLYRESLVENQFTEGMINTLELMVVGLNSIYNSIVDVFTPILGSNNTANLFTIGNGYKSPTGKDLWYWVHIKSWQKTPFSLISIGMQFHQLSLAKMAEEENANDLVYEHIVPGKETVTVYYPAGKVQWIPLFKDFSYPPDSNFDRYYVANPVLFADPIHVNHIGYFKWASLITPKLKNMGWDTLPELAMYNGESCRNWNCGSAGEPPIGDEIIDELKPQPVEVIPSNIDWLLLICFFTGKCW